MWYVFDCHIILPRRTMWLHQWCHVVNSNHRQRVALASFRFYLMIVLMYVDTSLYQVTITNVERAPMDTNMAVTVGHQLPPQTTTPINSSNLMLSNRRNMPENFIHSDMHWKAMSSWVMVKVSVRPLNSLLTPASSEPTWELGIYNLALIQSYNVFYSML